MLHTVSIVTAVLAVLGSALVVGGAQAQATRTWVSGAGDDANPCSRSAPCKTFTGAIVKTAAGGEINCLDPGGFGTLTIIKSITIDCAATLGSILAIGGVNGIVINGGQIIVNLRNLSIDGAYSGVNGIRYDNASVVHVENCEIFAFRSGSPNGFGILLNASTPGELFVRDTTISHNGLGTAGGGIGVMPITGKMLVVLDNVSLIDNTVGLRAQPGAGASLNISVTDSALGHNSVHGLVVNTPGPAATVVVEGSTLSENTSSGVRAEGANARVRLANNQITGNGTAITLTNGAQILSYGNNQIDGNTSPGTTPAIIPQR